MKTSMRQKKAVYDKVLIKEKKEKFASPGYLQWNTPCVACSP